MCLILEVWRYSGIPCRIKLKLHSLCICWSINSATIWLKHESPIKTISSVWIIWLYIMTVLIDKSCIMLVYVELLYPFYLTLEELWKLSEFINRSPFLVEMHQSTNTFIVVEPCAGQWTSNQISAANLIYLMILKLSPYRFQPVLCCLIWLYIYFNIIVWLDLSCFCLTVPSHYSNQCWSISSWE